MFLSVYGHVNLDLILNLPRFPEPNTSIELIDSRRYFGGTGGNIARIAAALGTPLYLVSFVGEDFPEDYMSALKNDGVDVRFLRRVKGYHTPTCWIMSDREHNQIAVMDQGPMRDMERFEPEIEPVRDAEIIHITTGRPEFYLKVARIARDMGKRIAFDPAQELHYVYTAETFNAMMEYANLFFCNEAEAGKALEFSGMSDLSDMLDRVEIIVQTLGKRGSRILTRDEEVFIPGVKVEKAVDTTGAGDAYRGGFYAALYRGYPLEACGAAGAITASEVIKVPGGQTSIPSWEFVEKGLRERGYAPKKHA